MSLLKESVDMRAIRKFAPNVLLGMLALAFGAATLIRYGSLSDGAMRALLWPHAKITEAFYHIELPYQNGVGYVALEWDFAIGPFCMGVRFIVMLFSMTVCFFVSRFHGFRKIIFFALSLIGSVAVGIVASCVRIVGSIPFLSSRQFTAIHAGTGAVVYLVALVGIYALMNRITGGFANERQ